jgi:acetoin:2,6-dichlorophenolindophenol oxidoreductase subunit alpha
MSATTQHDVDIAPETLQTMFHRMVIARGIEDTFAQWVKDGSFTGAWHPGRGQEAAAIGLMGALTPDDQIMYHHRGTTWPIARGLKVEPVLADLLGRTNGTTHGKGGGNPHWVDLDLGIIGSGGTLGTAHVLAGGLALGKQILGKPGIAVAGFGDGTSARGTFHETLMQATAWNLPLLYFVENNGWAVGTPFSAISPRRTVADKGEGYGIPAEKIDGWDAVEVYAAVKRARDHIVAGNGPAMVEVIVRRLEGHWMGDAQKYRDKDELTDYRDPVEVLEGYLDDADVTRIRAEAMAELEVGAAAALAGPIPGPEILFHNLYAE